jgi:sulfur carrier protein ThiS
MSASLVVVRNPFHPAKDREQYAVSPGQTFADLAPKAGVFIIVRNGQAVLRADWQQEAQDGDLIAIVFLPRSGGGGSNPLKMVLMIALAVYAPYMVNALAGEGFIAAAAGTFASTTMGTIATAVVGMAGNALINAAFGTPSTTSSLKTASLAAPSPTYNLQAQGNMARLDGAIPEQFGRLACYPDFAAQPYLEYAGNEQYLYQLLCIGRGEYDIEQIRIEDTNITSFEEIETEVIGPHAACTLFPTNVDTSPAVSGQEMEYNVYLGPFVANSAETDANALGLDFVFARGLYYANDGGGLDPVGITWTVEAREIDDDGVPVGAGTYTALGSESISIATTTPQRISKRYSVTAARYEVRVKRTSTKYTDSRYGNDIAWAGLRAYLPETRDFGDVTLLAIKARATDNLSAQAARKFNVICTRRLPAWNGSSFGTATATSSIAWALAYCCINADLPETRIDLDGLLALDAIWAARGDECNARFDSSISFWEAITKIARCGRAYPYMQGGIVRFVRDQPQTVPVALFSMRNIVRGSFAVQYLTPHEAMADAIEVSYFDDTRWQMKRVQAKLAGSTAAKPVKMELFGITDRDQAWREGMHEAGCNRYRRKIIKFASDMEGFIPSYGDLIAVAHDMPQWGQTAEAVAWDAGMLTLTVNEPLTWGSGTHYIGLRKRNGSVDGPIAVTIGANAYKLVLASAPAETPYTGQAEERTHIVFGLGETWRQPARVIAVRPRGLEQVEIECINEDPAVHTVTDGQSVPATNYSQLDTRWTAPVIEGLTAASSLNAPELMLLSWRPAPGADHYLVEQSSDGTTWTRTGEPSSNNYTATALYGAATLVRVAAVGMTRGPWVTIGYGSFADYMWNADDSTLMWSADDSTLMWRY